MRSFRMRVQQLGIGLLELMLALAIIAILIVMATRYFGTASRSQEVNTAEQQITEIYQALYQYSQTNGGSYDGADSASNISGYLTSATTTEHKGAFDGTWDVKGGVATLTAPKLTVDVCQIIANKIPKDVAKSTTCDDGKLKVTYQ